MKIELFAEDFKKLISLYQKEITESCQDSIEIRRDDKRILRQLLLVKVTKGFWREQPKINGNKFLDLISPDNWTTRYFLEDDGKDILLRALRVYYRDANAQYDNLKTYLFDRIEQNNVKKWIEVALDKDKIRKNILGGNKSWNIFLRDAYDFKYIPIDMHERRFQIRTGIFHFYLGKNVHNPDIEEHYEFALKSFSEDFLSDIKILGYNLGKNPGIVDLVIWLHCADKEVKNKIEIGGHEICSTDPNCDFCMLKKTCALGGK